MDAQTALLANHAQPPKSRQAATGVIYLSGHLPAKTAFHLLYPVKKRRQCDFCFKRNGI
jgi:hypothetical protein